MNIKTHEVTIIFVKIILSTKETKTCMCSDYMNGSYGNCSKTYGNGTICYVVEPSNCADKTFSSSTGKYYSWDACKGKKFSQS